MALSNYSDLLSSVASWLNRTDLTDRIPDFITLAESRLNRELRLRVMESEASLSLAAASRSVALPAGFVEPLGLWAVESQDRREIIYLSPDQMTVETASGEVRYWTITGANIQFERPTSAALSLIFRHLQSFTLSEAAPTNWLLTNHPDAYLFAALVEAAPYLKDSESLGIWDARTTKTIQEINRKEGKSRQLSTLRTDLPVLPSSRRLYGRTAYGTYG